MNALAILRDLADTWWTCVFHSTWQSSLVVLVAFGVVWLRRKRSASFLYAVLVVALLKFLVPPIISVPVLDSPAGQTVRAPLPAPIQTSVLSEDIPTALPENVDLLPAATVETHASPVTTSPPPQPVTTAEVPSPPAEEFPVGEPEAVEAPRQPLNVFAHWKLMLALLHGTGIVALGAMMAGSYLHLRRLIRGAHPASDAIENLSKDVAGRIHLRRPVSVLLTAEPCAPMATGLLKPRILLPKVLASLEPDEMRGVLAHELAHHRRMDLAFIWVEHLVTLLWWFNPLVWLLVRAIHRKREDCCDDVVLSLSLASHSQYCKTLLNAAKQLHQPYTPRLVFGCASKLHPMGQRLTRIMDTAVRRKAALTFGGIVVVALLSLVLLPTFLPVAAGTDETRTDTDVIPGTGHGPSGIVLRFDGVDDSVTIPPSSALDLKDDVSVSAWVRVDPNIGSVGAVLFRGDPRPGLDPYSLSVNRGRMQFDISFGDTGAKVDAPVDSGWHYWTGVRDTAENRLYLYMDGKPVSDVPCVGAITYDTANMGNEIGSVDHGHWGSWGFFKGEIDQVSVWNVARKPGDIQREMTQGIKPGEPGLVALWTFDEDGQTIHDSSPSNISATLGSSPKADANDPVRVLASMVSKQTAFTAPASGGLEILSASYGAGDKWVDVTKQLQQQVINDTLNIRASNDIAGDPIYGTKKQLKVRYRLGGQEDTTAVDEQQMLTIPATSASQLAGEHESATPSTDALIAAADAEIAQHYAKADPEVQEYIRWTARTFGRAHLWQPAGAFDALTPEARDRKVEHMAEVLNGEYGRHLCSALADTGAIQDKRLLPSLTKVASFHRDDVNYDCRPKWMAVSALGRQDDISAVPTLIPLVDHGNQNTRMWAQASLARLTGQNFGEDKQAWGKWWNDSGHEPKIDLSELKPWVPLDQRMSTESAAPPVATPAPASVPAESQAVVDALPGDLVFKGTYFHRSRGHDLSEPSTVWIKKTDQGEVIGASYLPTFNATTVAYVSFAQDFHRYEGHYHGREGRPPSTRYLDLKDGAVTVTYEGGDKDGQTETLTVPSGAMFVPNSRPDSYTAHMAIAAFQATIGFPAEPAEVLCYDWDNAGKGMASYTVRLENRGKEEVSVPAGTFNANHFVETQTSFGDTWFKKRPGHVTDYWMLDNGVMVRILRHREPYELQLLSVETPTELPGQVAGKSPAKSHRDLSAMSGADLRAQAKADYDACREYRNRHRKSRGYLEDHHAERLAYWQEGAKRGIPEAQTLLALCYAYGVGVEPNDAKEAELLQQAAEQGDAVAMFNLAQSYVSGRGVAQNNEEGIQWYRKAVELGDSGAMWHMAFYLRQGNVVPKDDAKAVELLEQSAKCGNARAMLLLGDMLNAGDGVPKNEAEATRLYAKAAGLGYDEARERVRQMQAQTGAQPATPSGTLTILSAMYGAKDNWIDVTDTLKRQIQNNTLEVRVSGGLGGEPIPGVKKRLDVHYRLGERTFVTSVNELETLRLPGSSHGASNLSRQDASTSLATQSMPGRGPVERTLTPLKRDGNTVVFGREATAQVLASYDYTEVVNKLEPKLVEDEDGNVTGITSDNFAKMLLAGAIGLQNGDVINTVNGVKIDSDQKLMEIFTRFSNATVFRLGITRDGKPATLTVELE